MASQEQETFFNELYDNTHRKVLAYIIAKCGNTEDIADIFQETYLEIVKVIKRKGIDYFQNPDALAMQIAKRKVYKHYSIIERINLKNKMHENDLDTETASGVSLEDYVIRNEAVSQVFSYLAGKDLLTRKIFYLHYYLDMPLTKVAKTLSIHESTVKNRIYRTLREIKWDLTGKAEKNDESEVIIKKSM